MMTMAIHSRWMGVKPESIYATGGAACNKEILHIMAQVFDAAVYQFEVGNSAALGAALRAYHRVGGGFAAPHMRQGADDAEGGQRGGRRHQHARRRVAQRPPHPRRPRAARPGRASPARMGPRRLACKEGLRCMLVAARNLGIKKQASNIN